MLLLVAMTDLAVEHAVSIDATVIGPQGSMAFPLRQPAAGPAEAPVVVEAAVAGDVVAIDPAGEAVEVVDLSLALAKAATTWCWLRKAAKDWLVSTTCTTSVLATRETGETTVPLQRKRRSTNQSTILEVFSIRLTELGPETNS